LRKPICMNIRTTANPIPDDASRSFDKLEVVLSQASGVRIKESVGIARVVVSGGFYDTTYARRRRCDKPEWPEWRGLKLST